MSQVIHIVLFKWNEGISAHQTSEIKTELLLLKEHIDGILETNVGDNFSARSQGYDTALVTRFISKEALQAYGPHEAHQRVVTQMIRPVCKDTLVIDFEV